MNIVQVISYLYPAWSYGGPGKLVYELSLELEKNGHDVRILSTDAYSKVRRRMLEDTGPLAKNIRYYFFPNISNALAFRYKAFVPLVNPYSLYSAIARADAVHIHEFFTPLAIFCSVAARLMRKPYLFSAHGTLDLFHLRHRGKLKSVFMRFFGYTMLRHAAGMIAATTDETAEYKTIGIDSDKIIHIPNGIATKDLTVEHPQGEFKKRFGINASQKIVLYLGRINRLKGLDVLIRAFAARDVSDVAVLVIAGSDDGFLPELTALVGELGLSGKVIFPGIMAGKDKVEMYRDSDVFVYPSPAEGFSIAILEAAAAGLPLVITEGCKFPALEAAGGGFIVNAQNVEQIADAVTRLLKNKTMRKTMGEKARKLILKEYSIETMAKKLEAFYMLKATS